MSENTQPGGPEPTESDVRHPGRGAGRLLRRVTAGLVVLVLALAGVAYWYDLGTRWLGWEYPSPIDQPAEVAPPPGLTLPTPVAAPAVASSTRPVPADPDAVRRALGRLVAGKDLGRHVAVDVAELDGTPVYRHGATHITPASTMKLLTTTAALRALGPEHRFRTSVVTSGRGRLVVLVGGGDPLLARAPDATDGLYPARADLQTLARSTAQALKGLGRSRVRLHYDTSLFTGPGVNPTWPASYVADDVVSPISPLWVDEGRERPGLAARSDDPAAAAAAVFVKELAKRGIQVRGRVVDRPAPTDATELASVRSAPLSEIVQHVLEVSDNEGAEVLLRQLAVARGLPASFDGGVRALRSVLDGLGVDTSGETILDGSGLSRRDRIEPGTLLGVLGAASSRAHPDLRGVVDGLPVAGFTGSLTYRFDTGDPAGLGLVHAKTGTLTGVHGLAGVVTTEDGSVLTFTALADRVKVPRTLAARARLDQIAAALAGCRCGAPPRPTPSTTGPSASPTP